MKKVRTYLRLLSFTLPFLTYSIQAQQPLDLKTAMKYTVEHHASVQKAKIEINKGEAFVRQSLSSGPSTYYRRGCWKVFRTP